VVIWASAAFADFESIRKFIGHGPTSHIGAGIAGAVIGVAGNLVVARYKPAAGWRINSATLIADARHSWLDALSSAGHWRPGVIPAKSAPRPSPHLRARERAGPAATACGASPVTGQVFRLAVAGQAGGRPGRGQPPVPWSGPAALSCCGIRAR
jgi:hypothetical protein